MKYFYVMGHLLILFLEHTVFRYSINSIAVGSICQEIIIMSEETSVRRRIQKPVSHQNHLVAIAIRSPLGRRAITTEALSFRQCQTL